MNPNQPTPNAPFGSETIFSTDNLKSRLLEGSKRLLERNPFYLISAGLLLYGINLFSADPSFAHVETSRLGFNFTTLLLYEFLLVITAVFLARRKIWYDSLLLVGLENLFVLIPFSLLSRAVFTESALSWWMCGAALLFATLKFWILKTSIRQLYLPRRLLSFAGIILILNAALPIVSHHFANDAKILTSILIVGWFVLLPALIFLFDFIPAPTFRSEAPAQKHWAQIQYGIWLIVTGLHLGGVGYVHTFHWQIAFLAPTAWILAWIGVRRCLAMPESESLFKNVTALFPSFAALLALGYADEKLFSALNILNVAIYGWIYAQRKDVVMRTYAFLSIAAGTALFPKSWGLSLTPEFHRELAVAVSLGTSFILWSLLSRDPRKCIVGVLAFVAGSSIFLSLDIHQLIQVALIYVLSHSLLWDDEHFVGSKGARVLFALVWFAHSLFWLKEMPSDSWYHTFPYGASFMVMLLSAFMVVIYSVRWFFLKRRDKWILPATALAIVAAKGIMNIPKIQTTMPAGFWPIVGSFLLFAVGTTVALTKPRWSKAGSKGTRGN